MKIPKRMVERLKKMPGCVDTALTCGALKARPVARKNCQRSEPALWMIQRPCTAEDPNFARQNQPL